MKWLLYQLLNKGLSRVGLVLVPKRELKPSSIGSVGHGYPRRDVIRGNDTNGGLRRHLVDTNRTRWLDIGCGGNLEKTFHYIDIFPEGIVDRDFRDRYLRIDIVNASLERLEKLGKFDFIRMQHVFEHFSPEDGRKVIERCALLLNPNGYLLITTPDLRIHAQVYLSGRYKDEYELAGFREAAWKRIAPGAPDSFYFSIFAHSLLYERHLWCYDKEGLTYLLEQTSAFRNIEEIDSNHAFASVPFTHNRPHEDVCILATRQ